jgi:hypothetical protein
LLSLLLDTATAYLSTYHYQNIEIPIESRVVWTMRKSRYAEAEGGENMLEASECFFRY